jgi:hypothetical protein
MNPPLSLQYCVLLLDIERLGKKPCLSNNYQLSVKRKKRQPNYKAPCFCPCQFTSQSSCPQPMYALTRRSIFSLVFPNPATPNHTFLTHSTDKDSSLKVLSSSSQDSHVLSLKVSLLSCHRVRSRECGWQFTLFQVFSQQTSLSTRNVPNLWTRSSLLSCVFLLENLLSTHTLRTAESKQKWHPKQLSWQFKQEDRLFAL